MRDDPSPSRVDRWDWYGSGDETSMSEAAPRGAHSGRADNSQEQVLWECGLVLAIPLACAAVVEVAMKFSGA